MGESEGKTEVETERTSKIEETKGEQEGSTKDFSPPFFQKKKRI